MERSLPQFDSFNAVEANLMEKNRKTPKSLVSTAVTEMSMELDHHSAILFSIRLFLSPFSSPLLQLCMLS